MPANYCLITSRLWGLRSVGLAQFQKKARIPHLRDSSSILTGQKRDGFLSLRSWVFAWPIRQAPELLQVRRLGISDQTLQSKLLNSREMRVSPRWRKTCTATTRPPPRIGVGFFLGSANFCCAQC